MQFPAGLLAREIPVDGSAFVVDPAVPGVDFAAQRSQIGDSALAKTLAAKQARFDLDLVWLVWLV